MNCRMRSMRTVCHPKRAAGRLVTACAALRSSLYVANTVTPPRRPPCATQVICPTKSGGTGTSGRCPRAERATWPVAESHGSLARMTWRTNGCHRPAADIHPHAAQRHSRATRSNRTRKQTPSAHLSCRATRKPVSFGRKSCQLRPRPETARVPRALTCAQTESSGACVKFGGACLGSGGAPRATVCARVTRACAPPASAGAPPETPCAPSKKPRASSCSLGARGSGPRGWGGRAGAPGGTPRPQVTARS